jgi:hypothetical protein
MEKFYLVKAKSIDGKTYPSTREHETFESAKYEAVRLSRKMPELEFHITISIAVIQTKLDTQINFIEEIKKEVDF